jgi:DNA mismatch repair protein MutL
MQVHKTYLVAETQEGLIIVDQHALHERILYEQLRQRLGQGHIASQQLLVPMPVELTNQQRAKLEQIKEILAQVGIVLVEFGPESVAVQAFPAILDRADPAAAVQDIVDRLADVPSDSASEQVLEQVLQSMACKAAVKAGDKLSDQEMTHLLAQAPSTHKSSNCPHGRPTTLKMSLAELEKQFKRT